MSIAVVIDEHDIVQPIVEGTILRIIQDDFSCIDLRNPALDVTEGRRGAALQAAIGQGATLFVAPPETFCQLSYEKARNEHISFFNIGPNEPFEKVLQAIQAGEIQGVTQLPESEIVPSIPIT